MPLSGVTPVSPTAGSRAQGTRALAANTTIPVATTPTTIPRPVARASARVSTGPVWAARTADSVPSESGTNSPASSATGTPEIATATA